MSDVKFARLREYVSKIGSGKTPRGGASSYQATGIPLIRSQNVLCGALNLNDVAFISNDIHAQMSGSAVKGKDVLLNITGASIGRSCVAPDSLAEANVNQHVCIIRTKDTLEPHFLSAFLNSYEGQKQIWSFQGGGSREGLNFEQIGRFIISVFSLPEQRKIGEILRTWDEAIEKLEGLKAAKERLGRRLLYILLTGQKRYPGHTEEWKTCRLMDVASVSKGKALTKKDITPGVYPVIAGGKTSPYSHSGYTHEDIVSVSASGAYAGYVSLHREKVWASDCSVIEAKDGHDILFLYYMLRMNQNRIYSLQIGGAQPHVYSKDLAMMRVPIPPLPEQKKITLIFSTIDCEIDALKNEMDRLKLQKRGLMQKLLTGEWRVPVEGRHD